jgi:hypothetical protein
MPYRYDLTPFVVDVRRRLAEFNLGAPGRYRNSHDPDKYDLTASDAYGCADAANILYSLGELPSGGAERDRFVAELQAHQDPETGEFNHQTHTRFHTSGQLVGGLEVLDARPLHPMRFLHPLLEPGAIEQFLDQLAWADDPWFSSWDGAGAAAVLAVTGEAPAEWFDRYFAWLDAETDPHTGFLRKDRMLPFEVPRGFYANLAGTFHYFFNYAHLRRPVPYPDRVIDSALLLYEKEPYPIARDVVGYPEVDWVYVITTAAKQTGYRRDEAIAALWDVADRVAMAVNDPAHRAANPYLNTVHGMLGTVCTVAELQSALPGAYYTPRPLRHVLNRRPFI